MLGLNPAARLLDITHSIPPQDVMSAALVLEAAIDVFPERTIHVVVVDPGVGSERAILAVEWNHQRLIAPDNGVLTCLLNRADASRVVQVENADYFRSNVAPTFHGRDIMAPVAAHWSLGADISSFGRPRERPATETGADAANGVSEVHPALASGPPAAARSKPDPVRLDMVAAGRRSTGVDGHVVSIDSFGNALTSILDAHVPPACRPGAVVSTGEAMIRGIRGIYSDVEPGEPVALFGSAGRLELAVNRGRADEMFHLRIGEAVVVEWNSNDDS